MRIQITIVLTLLILLSFQSQAVIKSVSPQESFLQENFGIDNIQDFLDLSPKDITKNTGKKQKLKDKIVLRLVQKRIKKKIKNNKFFDISEEYPNATNDFNVGGFLLGFFLGIIGVLLAVLFGGNAVKSSLIGLLCWIIVLVIVVASLGSGV